jgi:hypothetical protein
MERLGQGDTEVNVESQEFRQGGRMGDTRLKMEICRMKKREIFICDKGRELINHPGGAVYVL